MSEEKLEQLLFAYFNNTIDREECAELLKYIDEADGESSLMAIDIVLQQYKSGPVFNEVQAKEVFGRILSDYRMAERNSIKPNNQNPIAKISYGSWFRYAAVLFVFLGLGIYFLNNGNIQKGSADQSTGEIVQAITDRTKATLTIAGKEVILLNDGESGLITISENKAISKTKNGELIYNSLGNGASPGNSIVDNVLSVPRGGSYQIILSDGTKVWINSESSLSFPAIFKGDNREVTLIGEAYFEVAKNKGMPFRVSANGTLVEVLGTHFNVSAYKDDEFVKTTLLEGSVSVVNNGNRVILKPHQQAIGDVKNGSLSVKATNTEEVMAWKNGYFVFEEVDIKTILKSLARWYNVDITYNGKITSQKFGGTFSRSKDISELLNYLETLGDVHFKKEGRRVIVMP